VKRLLLLALVIIGTAAVQAQPVSVAGNWKVSANVSGNASESTCTFSQKDADLTGTCKGERGDVTITGKVDGKTVSWQFDTQYEGQTLTVYYSGTLDSSEKIAGSINVQPMNVSGEFTAARAK
jgi:hypothetical protein